MYCFLFQRLYRILCMCCSMLLWQKHIHTWGAHLTCMSLSSSLYLLLIKSLLSTSIFSSNCVDEMNTEALGWLYCICALVPFIYCERVSVCVRERRQGIIIAHLLLTPANKSIICFCSVSHLCTDSCWISLLNRWKMQTDVCVIWDRSVSVSKLFPQTCESAVYIGNILTDTEAHK